MQVICDRKVWRAFVRRALRRHPSKEYIEAAWGRVCSDSVHICAFTDVEHIATKSSIVYDPEEVKEHTPSGKLEYLGTIHSHPDCADPSPSEQDWRDALEQDELTIGILAIWKPKDGKRRRTRGVFWPSTRPLDIKLSN